MRHQNRIFHLVEAPHFLWDPKKGRFIYDSSATSGCFSPKIFLRASRAREAFKTISSGLPCFSSVRWITFKGNGKAKERTHGHIEPKRKTDWPGWSEKMLGAIRKKVRY